MMVPAAGGGRCGRRAVLAEGYIPYWLGVAEDRDAAMIEIAWRVVDARTVVFTKTMTSSPWPGTSLATGDLDAEVATLKRDPGKDLVAYGGSSFVSALIERRLIDEYHLFVNPVALGRGDPIFARAAVAQPLELLRAVPFPSGEPDSVGDRVVTTFGVGPRRRLHPRVGAAVGALRRVRSVA